MLNLSLIRRAVAASSVSAVAREAGMTRANLHAILTGRQVDPKLSTIERLAQAIGVEARQLIR